MMDAGSDLWADARRRLDPKSEDRLRELEDLGLKKSSNLSDDIDIMIGLTESKRKDCDKKSWTIKMGSHELKLRDYANKIITWLKAFKDVGDAAVQYDPGHAALPWAAFRFILQVS